MSQFITANGVSTTLAAALTSVTASLTVSSTINLPPLESGQIIPLILRSASASGVFEIVYGTAISGATITVERGMEGSNPQNFNVGDYVLCGPTAGTNALITAVMNPVASETFPQAYGALVIPGTLSAGITLGLPEAPAVGTSYIVYGANDSVTVDTGTTSGTPALLLPDGSSVYTWTIPAGQVGQGIRVDFDGTNWRAQTFGQTVVAPAQESNEAVQLGQMSNGSISAEFDNLTSNGLSSLANYQELQGSIFTSDTAGWTETVDLADGTVQVITLNSSGTLAFSGVAPSGFACSVVLYLEQGSAGSAGVTWPSGTLWGYGVPPALSTAAGAIDVVTLTTFDGGSTWFGFVVGQGMAA